MTLPEGPIGPPQPNLQPLLAAVDGAHSAESLVQATRALALALATTPSGPTALTPEMENAIRTLVGVTGGGLARGYRPQCAPRRRPGPRSATP